MTRTLFIASQPFFEWRGSPIRLGFDVLALAQSGYAVDFLTLPIGQRREVEGVRIVRAPNLFRAKRISIGPSALKLAFDGVIFFMALGMALKHRYRVIHGVEDAGLIALLVGRLTGAKVVFEKHSDPASYAGEGPRMGLVMRAYAAVERFMIRRSDAVIGTGPGLVAQARGVAPETPAHHIPDIPSSLATADAQSVRRVRAELLPRPDADLLATYVGSFAVYQGIDLLFDAIPRVVQACPQAHFAIIGGSEAQIAARRAALETAGVAGNVIFVGKVPPDTLPNYLAASDILLSPRISGINTPLKLLDYLKAERAIVATDHEANRLILDDETALLTPLTPEAFAAGIATLMQAPEQRAALAGRGAALIGSTYNLDIFRARLAACYSALL